MKETRQILIKGRVFTKQDIVAIWGKVNHEFLVSQKENHHSSIELTLNCADGTSYESDNSELLNDGDIIDLKKTEAVSIDYFDYELKKRISITLRHGDSSMLSFGSKLTVSGEERNWVAGMFDSLNTVIDAVRPQDFWLIKYKTLMLHVGAFGLGLAVYSLLDFLLYRHIQPTEAPSENVLALGNFLKENQIVLILIQICGIWLQGIFASYLIRDWVIKLWPSVEFDFGPEHKKIEKMKRQRLGIFLTIVIIPFVISLLFKYWN